MTQRHVGIGASIAILVGLCLLVAACGAKSKPAATSTSTAAAAPQTQAATTTTTAAPAPTAAPTAADCTSTGTVIEHIQLASPSAGAVYDYAYGLDRTFLDGFASSAPGVVAAHVTRLRDFVDRYAAAAKAAGIAPGIVSYNQAAPILAKLGMSSADFAEVRTSLESVSTWVAGGCKGGAAPAASATPAAITAATCASLASALGDISVGSHADRAVALDVYPLDYVNDGKVVEGFPAVPESVAADLLRVKTYLDRYATQANAAGLVSGTAPTDAQETTIVGAAHLDGPDQDQVPGSISALQGWAALGCPAAGIPQPKITTTTTTTPTTTTTEAASTAQATTSTTQTTSTAVPSHTSEADCRTLSHVVDDLLFFEGEPAIDYIRDRDFMDGYADRAPDVVSDAAKRVRDFYDKYAAAAQAAGVAPNKAPLPDQADKIASVVGNDNADVGRAVVTLDTWANTNDCS
jgi:hypothetical protein